MFIKHILLIFLFGSTTLFCKAQNLPIVNLLVSDSNAAIHTLDLPLQNADLSIDLKGNLIINDPWAYVTYYTDVDGDGLQGNISTVDGVAVKYYTKFDGLDNIGKVKSLGNTTVIYYDRFDNKLHLGKLKSVGSTSITYNDQFDGFDNVGKIKSVGELIITYYDRFDSEFNGKFKSIGDIRLTYYDRFSNAYMIGKVKSVIGKARNVNVYNIKSAVFNNADN